MTCFVDANIFLELQLEDERANECDDFFNRIDKNKIDSVTSDFIIYTCLLQIQNKTRSPEKMSDFMTFLTNLETLEILKPTHVTIEKTIKFMKKYKLDFDDALVVACMVENDVDILVSFDTDFNQVKEIKRIEPKDAI